MKSISNIFSLLKIYGLVITIFFIFRFILFLTEIDRIEGFDFNIIKAFLMGVRFDIVISGYILLIPYLVLSIMYIINKYNKFVYKIIFFWIFILFSISFAICSSDIPYFNQFFSRFTIGAFEWMDSPGFVFKMILQEPKYYTAIILYAIIVLVFFVLLKKIFFIPRETKRLNIPVKIIVSVLFAGIMFVGIRGRVQKKSPIRVGTAFFSNNAFLNQLGLNPVFTLMKSYLYSKDQRNKEILLMDNDLAISNMQEYLRIENPIQDYPIARKVFPDTLNEIKPNIIIIIMESMSAAKMLRHGNPYNLTPFLDSISYQSYYFNNIYTAGKHTFNGVFGTLFSFPAIYRQHPMKGSPLKRYNGIGNVLRKNGYTTTYFTTHDGQFDNAEGFLRANDFENIITQSDYPADKIKTTLGVPDDFLFEFSMPIINKLSSDNKPFFVTFMTASDHGPYYIPDYFKPTNTDVKKQIVEYADWSLQKFIKLASETDWFSNTIFVFIADHGEPISADYDISLDYHHSPLIFYAPGIIKNPKTFDCIGGQIDVFPTIMDFIKAPYINNTLGINLFKEKRPYIIINDDDKIGVLDNEFLLIMKNSGSALFKYRLCDKQNYSEEYSEKLTEMEKYAKSNLQTLQFLIKNNKQFID